MTDSYFYEPAKGHGLPHDPFNAIVGPRPIGWISTKGTDGSLNLAPYSFFNAFCYTPPIIGFSTTHAPKDSLRNARETREFAWNLVTRDLAEAMNLTCAPLPYGQDEFAHAGLTPVASRTIAAPRVAESPVSFECKVCDVIDLKGHDGRPAAGWLVLAEVVAVHIASHLLKDGIYDTFNSGVVMRAGGPTAYAAIGPDNRFDMVRPTK
ncbi:flavin reductase family protein [Roseomonas sp. 18066]|uniref:flavin reductase family protein n=1 Tax=Roseomonas sp. 18066 TaxID=2681412 RepID=UPI00135B61A2|nr:flavin reductase family protein [Roseomonas sp. 18066]